MIPGPGTRMPTLAATAATATTPDGGPDGRNRDMTATADRLGSRGSAPAGPSRHSRLADPLVARLRPYTTTIFAEMSALAVRTGSVNLGQGFPDEDGPQAMIEAAAAALRAGRNQYPPGHGTPELLDAVVAHQARHYGVELDPSQVVATTGATEAIAAALLGLVDPGDEVVVLEPYYDSYVAMIQFAGAVR